MRLHIHRISAPTTPVISDELDTPENDEEYLLSIIKLVMKLGVMSDMTVPVNGSIVGFNPKDISMIAIDEVPQRVIDFEAEQATRPRPRVRSY